METISVYVALSLVFPIDPPVTLTNQGLEVPGKPDAISQLERLSPLPLLSRLVGRKGEPLATEPRNACDRLVVITASSEWGISGRIGPL